MTPKEKFIRAVGNAAEEFETETGMSVTLVRLVYERLYEASNPGGKRILYYIELEAS